MSHSSVVTWTTIISCYGVHGKGEQSLILFEKMRDSGFLPNSITFTFVLASCSHSGLINQGRSGHLEEALELVKKIPQLAPPNVWGALLGASLSSAGLPYNFLLPTNPLWQYASAPIVFKLRGSNSVATLNSLYVYDTESVSPIAIFSGLHYAAITDIAWSSNAKYLALSSQDGYCTLVEFENDELGSPLPIKDTEVHKEENKNAVTEKPEDMEIITSEVGNTVERRPPSSVHKEENKKAVTKKADDMEITTSEVGNTVERRPPNELNKATQTSTGTISAPDSNKPAAKSSIGTTVPNKPAKRRITPMAIDKP
ncbi:Chromatin assembly factor 1 subunit fas2 [Thalictrum thalictroides]|uniref:Chromatin assembly factor 1 subunit fas2 n=1 Tax=Thalictrum thalictroides TaxID=46969 RepID=A0A7J6URI1_THATH|nr:Chromatin assembly factor 1 subunit fas2 [Thalictrum thalictroides]